MVVLDLEATNQIDTTSADTLAALLTDLRARGIDLMLVRVFYAVRRVLRRSGFEEMLGKDRMWHSISQGVRAAKKLRPEAVAGEQPDYDAGDERIAVDPGPVVVDAGPVVVRGIVVKGLDTGYGGDPETAGPRWWHRRP